MTPEECTSLDQVRTLLRGVVRARSLVTADWAQVEARALLWLAGDEANLQVYRDGGDPYIPAAARIFGVDASDVTSQQRAAGKVAVLALGFAGGVGALERMARKNHADLGADSTHIVESWRDLHPLVAGVRTGYEYVPDPAIPEDVPQVMRYDHPGPPVQERRGGFWRALQRAFRKGGAVGLVHYYHETGLTGGQDTVCVLPSGRAIRYRDVRQETVASSWTPGETETVTTYAAPRGGRAKIMRSVLVENVCQAVCRDLLAHALVALERAGFAVVLHVHDEIVCEAPASDLQLILDVCRAAPKWAEGMPISVVGGVSEQWAK